jgi:hypothetical protein
MPAALAAARADGPMPDDLAAGLDAALAEEAARPAVVSGGAAQTVTPLRPTSALRRQPRSGPRGMRLLQVAAVVVVLLGLGGLAVSGLRGLGGATGGGAGSSSAGGKAAPEAATRGTYPVSASGRNWTAGTLAAAVPRLLAGQVGPTVAPGAPTDSTDSTDSAGSPAGDRALAGVSSARLAGGQALAACLTALGGARTPLAVDLATFQGTDAAVIVLPDQSDATRVEVWVVGPSCSPADAALLYFASVPRS